MTDELKELERPDVYVVFGTWPGVEEQPLTAALTESDARHRKWGPCVRYVPGAKLEQLAKTAESAGIDSDNPDTCGVCHKHFHECEEDRSSHDDPPFTEANTFPSCVGARIRAALRQLSHEVRDD